MNLLQELWKEEDAVGVVEIILILVVLIGLVIIITAIIIPITNYILKNKLNLE